MAQIKRGRDSGSQPNCLRGGKRLSWRWMSHVLPDQLDLVKSESETALETRVWGGVCPFTLHLDTV